MSGDLFDTPGFIDTATRAAPKRPEWYVHKKPGRKARAVQHVAAPAEWAEQTKTRMPSNGDRLALSAAWTLAVSHDIDAALDVLSRYNLNRIADVRGLNIDNVHFDLVMIQMAHSA